MDPDENTTEEEVQKRLEVIFGGGHTTIKSGKTDIYVKDEVLVEIKAFDHWSVGLGQIIKYRRECPAKRQVLYLFGAMPKNEDWPSIADVCKDVGVEAMRDMVDYKNLVADYLATRRDSSFRSEPDIPVLEGDERQKLSGREYEALQHKMLAQLAAVTRTIRDHPTIDDGQMFERGMELYRACWSALNSLHAWIEEVNSERNIVGAFLDATFEKDPASRVPLRQFRLLLDSWLAKHRCKTVLNYRSEAVDVLTRMKIVKKKVGTEHMWIGIRVKPGVLESEKASPDRRTDTHPEHAWCPDHVTGDPSDTRPKYASVDPLALGTSVDDAE